MQTMRLGLLAGVLLSTLAAWLWLYLASQERVALIMLAAVFALGSLVVIALQRKRSLESRRITAHLALGAIVHLFVAGLVSAAERIEALGLMPALSSHWRYLSVGVLGVLAALYTWSRSTLTAKSHTQNASLDIEPAPPKQAQAKDFEWAPLFEGLQNDAARTRFVDALRRVHTLSGEAPVRRAAEQEAQRVLQDYERSLKEENENDVLTKAAELFEWGVQKIPELPQMDFSDLLMAKAVADIHADHQSVEHIFVDHRLLLPIHPITRGPAIEKCKERADAAKSALPLLRENGMRLSEALIASSPALRPFESVTGFQVVRVGEHYVTFEGNGRREALQMAFPTDEAVMIEVRHYVFDDDEREDMQRRVNRVRRYKGVLDAT